MNLILLVLLLWLLPTLAFLLVTLIAMPCAMIGRRIMRPFRREGDADAHPAGL